MIQTHWYDNDNLWESVAPFLFSNEAKTRAAPETDKILSLLELKKNDHILDLCCGQGRFVNELTQRGLHVTGVDRTVSFLRDGVSEIKHTGSYEFLQSDILHYRRKNAYNGILCMNYSFGYHQSDHQLKTILMNSFASLRSGGHLLLDLLSADQIIDAGEKLQRLEVDGNLLSGYRKLTLDGKRVEDEWKISSEDVSKRFWTSTRVFAPKELSDILLSCGFGSVDILGSLDACAYSKDKGRMIVVARK